MYYEIFYMGRGYPKENVINFWERSRSYSDYKIFSIFGNTPWYRHALYKCFMVRIWDMDIEYP